MELGRRGFIGTLIGGIVAGAAVRTWPFRVFSFPDKIVSTNLEWMGLDRSMPLFLRNGMGSIAVASTQSQLDYWLKSPYLRGSWKYEKESLEQQLVRRNLIRVMGESQYPGKRLDIRLDIPSEKEFHEQTQFSLDHTIGGM